MSRVALVSFQHGITPETLEIMARILMETAAELRAGEGMGNA
jgi:hypothetical protein